MSDKKTIFDANEVTLKWQGVVKCRKKSDVIHAAQVPVPFFVDTPEGRMTGDAFDYLMFGVEGEKYPCKKEIFDKTYDFIDGGE